MSPPRDRYVYYPNTLEVPEAVAVNIRGRSFKIAAEVDITPRRRVALLFAHGHQFGGHALYLKDGKLKYVYNYLGRERPGGRLRRGRADRQAVLGVEFTKESQTPAATIGTFDAVHRRRRRSASSTDVKTQNGKFNLCGEGLNIGREARQRRREP